MVFPTPTQQRRIARTLHGGGIIAYPTEAIWGLGCDPLNGDAVLRLLELKRRPWQKGLILIAADFAQLTDYLLPLDTGTEQRVLATWPGPVTWVLPARPDTPSWLTGGRDALAVRVTAHPVAAALCRAFGGALVSTSANISNRRPARSATAVRRIFDDRIDYVVHGPLGGRRQCSEIRDGRNGAVLRAG